MAIAGGGVTHANVMRYMQFGYSLGLRADRSIVGWGWHGRWTPANYYGQDRPPGGTYKAIAEGTNYCVAIRRVCRYELAGDINDDCEVDFRDFAVMVGNWLIDCNLNPSDPACAPK